MESRSNSLTFALREFYGWENWAAENGVPISGNAEELARVAGAALGIEGDRVERVIQSVPNPGDCLPAAVFTVGEISAWRRIWKMNRAVYDAHCPDETKRVIQAPAQRTRHNTSEVFGGSFARGKSKQSLKVAGLQRSTTASIQSPEYSDSLGDWDCSLGIGKRQIQTFIGSAYYILSHSPAALLGAGNSPCHDRSALQKYSVHGQIYHLESEGLRLTVQAKGRGVIFQAVENTLELSKLTAFDINRFQAEASRLKQRHVSRGNILACCITVER